MLKPCPFCGSEAEVQSRDSFVSDVRWYWVNCSVCKAGRPQTLQPFAENAENAEKIWNDYCESLSPKAPRGYG
jgi:Lar family restriction alleviation protein